MCTVTRSWGVAVKCSKLMFLNTRVLVFYATAVASYS